MTDGERIMNWLNDYQMFQKRRDACEKLMFMLLASSRPYSNGYKHLKKEIFDCEMHMQTLREKIMIYGDY